MKEPSPARKRTLALHDRALRFSHAVNLNCPAHFSNVPSSTIWRQLVRSADGTSNNLIEADAASSDADFLSKMGIALREAKESGAALMKIRIATLDNHQHILKLDLEAEARQLSAIFATIIINMRARLARERSGQTPRRRSRA